ncbi:MAG: Grx4 family monothiol glutaredoxin [Legionellales bacterium]|nr:Grx4 family monothiol glutaredoxin [Legionellales bacterium]
MDITGKLKQEIQENTVILYMKGTKEFPQCGFSSHAVYILSQTGVDFETRDVLANPEVRQQLPLVSNWPTFPQLFIKGELIGGSDIVNEHFQSGELQRLLAEV